MDTLKSMILIVPSFLTIILNGVKSLSTVSRVVPVDDAVGVQMVDAFYDLFEEFLSSELRKRAFAFDETGELLSIDQLHDRVERGLVSVLK